ncbi:hypothetical protein CLOP_g22404 [Closterium sp. NIES-67]|nr:hypothetical protein CLOP_g22404 [Closterium sp. NIES-67]
MPKLTLHGTAISPYTRRVIMTLYEMGVEMGVEDFVHIPVSPLTGGTKTPDFIKMQPFARIPVLEDNGSIIYESRTLMRYVADKYMDQGPNLLGDTLMERALVNQWIDIEGHTFSPPVMILVYERVFKSHLHKRPCDEERWKDGREKLSRVLDIYEKHLEGRDYLVGNSFSLADLTHLPFTELLPAAGAFDLIESRPNVCRWWARISSRNAWKRTQQVEPYEF